MQVGTLEIQLLANMARLQTDMDKAKRSVGDAVEKMNQALGTIGIGISVAGFSSLVKSVADVGDKFNDLRKITGLTVEELAGLDKAAALNGTNLDQVAKAVGIMSKNMVAGSAGLQALGIASRQANGDFRTTGEVLLDVADRFSRMEDGVQKAALAQEIFGKSGRELIPLLNEGRSALQSQIEAYGQASGMTTLLAEESDRFNDILTLLGGKISAVKNTFVAELLPTLNNIGTAMLDSGQNTTQFSSAARIAIPVLKGLAIAGFTVVDTFRGMGREIGARAAQLGAFATGDIKGAGFIGDALAADNAKSRAEYDKFVETVMSSDKAVEQFTETQREYLKVESRIPGVVAKSNKVLAEKRTLTDAEQLALLRQQESTKDTIALNQRVIAVTESVATEQEIYNRKLEELNQLKPYLSVETYQRALLKLNDTTKKTAEVSRQTTDQVSQQWIQAGRNIQSALSNSIFDFFNDGLNGMVRSFKTAILRMISEAAALRMSEGIGNMLLGGVGGAGGSGGTGGLLSSLLGTFGGTGGGIRTGGGVTTGTFSNQGGAGTAFIGGKGTAIGGSGMGVNATRGAGMGSSLMGMAALAGPYGIAAAAAIMVGMELDKKYGDYKVSGFNKFGMKGLDKSDPIAVIANQFGIKGPGEIMGKFLFGRGPYKFRQQSIQGDINAGGLDGTITDIFKSKGGVFVKNKHKEFEKDIPSEIIRDIDKNIKSIYKSTGEFAANLGIDAKSIDTFTKEIQIKSEKGKALNTEKVKEELDAFNEDLIKSFMPDIDNFKLTGETAGQTFARLNNELEALKSGVQNLGGSASFAKELIMSMSIDTRSAIIDMAGGIDKLIEKTQFFSENFLTSSEQLAPVIASVNEEMTRLGFASVTTKEQFKGLIQSLEISAETRNALLDIAPAFLQIINAAQQIKDAANQNTLALAEAFAPEEVIKIKMDMANEAMKKFGLSADTSREKITGLLRSFVMSGGMFTDMADDVMKAATLYNDYQSQLNNSSVTAAGALSLEAQADNAMAKLLKSADAERNKLTLKYNDAVKISNDRIAAVTESVNKLKNVSDMVRQTVNDISPMSLEQARSQIANGTADSSNLADALNVLRNQNDTSAFSNVLEFQRSQAQSATVLNKFANTVEGQLTLEQRSLSALEAARDRLDAGFKSDIERLDKLLTDAQAQVDFLKNIDTNILSMSTAIGELNRILVQAGGKAVGGGVVSGGGPGSKPPISGNTSISSADIVKFASTHTPMETYLAAKKYGVTSGQIAATGIYTQQQINDWIKQQGLASFDVGGKVPKTGIAMIHKDEQILTKTESEDMSSQLKKLTIAVESLTIANNKNNRRFQKWDDEGMPPVRESA